MATVRLQRISRTNVRYWLALAALAGLLAGILVGPALAQAPTASPTITGGETREHTISVAGMGSVFVAPDQADVQLGVSVTRDTVKGARDDAAAAMNAVLAAVRAAGVADADVRTSTLSIGPVYDYSREDQLIAGYQVTNIVSILVRDLDKLAAVIDDSVAAGATTVSSVTFRVGDPTAAERQAREAAVRDARARADTLASAAGVKIVGVASISESFSAPWSWRGGDTSGEAPTPVQPGTSEVTVTVAISYVVE